MYPNPQDALPLPFRPDIAQYRKRAKELAAACKSGSQDDFREWAARWLADLARHAPAHEVPSQRDGARRIEQITAYAHSRLTSAGCALSEAQFVIARAHGFESWPKFVRHLEQLGGESSETSTFERAANAIVNGDRVLLERLLREDAGLVRARSTREHRATLLHYVAANGVENFRQVTPPNIVDIARLLLDAGAEVDAEADVYGGGATTLGLVVTSAHPRQMKVQDALADLLLDRGARMGAPVRDCLMNGCPEAAVHLVMRGAPVRTLEEAAGVGRLDLLQHIWDRGGSDRAGDGEKALRMAAWYGKPEVIVQLLQLGVNVEARDAKDGDTALHIAAFNGQAESAAILLRHGADVEAIDKVYGTPPIVWALHAWLVENRSNAADYRAVVRLLAEHGARVKPEWVDDRRLRDDPELWRLLQFA
ncbi:MAG TPA: ankyrin repeat domain-containing protein [Gemmatimonadaceae bacterium]|nr:ankyrin repeat domain-containing protein [Gemmatimonadaceae bacterium]